MHSVEKAVSFRCVCKQKQRSWGQSWAHVVRERKCWHIRWTLRERDWPRMSRNCSHSSTAPERETASMRQPITTSGYQSHTACQCWVLEHLFDYMNMLLLCCLVGELVGRTTDQQRRAQKISRECVSYPQPARDWKGFMFYSVLIISKYYSIIFIIILSIILYFFIRSCFRSFYR